jgi:hypothetical protein
MAGSARGATGSGAREGGVGRRGHPRSAHGGANPAGPPGVRGASSPLRVPSVSIEVTKLPPCLAFADEPTADPV